MVKYGQVYIIKAQDCIQLWELLSEIKMLKNLTVMTCTMEPFGKNDTPAQCSFLKLVQKFASLESLQLQHNEPCLSCEDALYEIYPLLL